MFASRGFRLASLFACIVVAFSVVSVDEAQARKSGSFGNRGGRTFQSAPTTNTAPAPTAPVQRTTAPNNASTNPGAATAQQRGGFMGGFGGAMLRGVMLGGLLGLLFGGGFGGLAGMFGMLVQIALIGGAIYLVMRMMKSRSPAQPAMAGANAGGGMNRTAHEPASNGNSLGGLGGLGGFGGKPRARSAEDSNDLGLGLEDLQVFERMLTDVQAAFSREDRVALSQLATAEVVSYLGEELDDNAARGLRNDVSDVRLLQGDLAESWREGSSEYATAAMRYSAIDINRDRTTGAVVEGNAEIPSESTELWTFVRLRGGDWQLSAIQEA